MSPAVIAAGLGALGWVAMVITLLRGIGPVAARSPSSQSATLEQDLMALSAEAQAFVDRINAVKAKIPDAVTAAEQAKTDQFNEDMAGVAEAVTELESVVAALSPPSADPQPTEQPAEGQ